MRTHLGTAGMVLLVSGIFAGCSWTGRFTSPGYASATDAPPATSAPGAAPEAAPALAANKRSSLPLEAPPYAPCSCPPAICSPAPCAPICGLPCESGRGGWHVGATLGYGFSLGGDPSDPCSYLGADVGYTFCGTPCGCWGLAAFYRTQSPRFDRDPGGEDGGDFHFVGVKLTYERTLHGRWFGWAGAGPEYFWTNDYLDDDSGVGLFAEVGVGYMLSRSLRVRAGVEAHLMNTDVGRQSAADDGESRWLVLFAPVVGLDFTF